MHPLPATTKQFTRSAWRFTAIGLLIYAVIYLTAEGLVYRTGDTNPFYKISTSAEQRYDWVILGASHAMPLDFSDFNAVMQRETGRTILNLAATGAGPLYNRFVLETFLETHSTANVLYVIDSFAFYSSEWNEDRFTDSKLLARTPFAVSIAARLANYVRLHDVDAMALLDYLSGFSKINNRDRFAPDIWEAEAKFDKAYRPSKTAEAKRIAYLYPDTDPAVRARYLAVLEGIIEMAVWDGIRVVLVKLPVPKRFYDQLPAEAGFDDTLSALADRHGVAFHDFSQAIDDPAAYLDTDHLNRTGATRFLEMHLRQILTSGGGES